MSPIYKTVTAFTILLAIPFAITLNPKNVNDTSISGLQIQSQNWSGTIRITGDVFFVPWTTLKILPGTKILFEKNKEIEGTNWTKYADEFIKKHNDPTGREGYNQAHHDLYAKIIAIGTKEKPITFTSASEKPEYADWDQLVLASGSRLDYVDLSYSHNGANIDGKNVSLTNSKFHDSLWSCVDSYSGGGLIQNNEIYHCWHQGIGLKKFSDNVVRGNYIHDAQLSINCEMGSRPQIVDNTIKAAPINPDCGPSINTKEILGSPDGIGGTYGGILIYPANENLP